MFTVAEQNWRASGARARLPKDHWLSALTMYDLSFYLYTQYRYTIMQGLPSPGDINFGAFAAERDDSLREYFIESTAFTNLRDGKKQIALGNRGSGKTAIFKMIAEHYRGRGHAVIEIQPEDYSYEVLTSVVAPESRSSWAKQSAYAVAWKYLVYVLAMKRVTEHSGKTLSTRPKINFKSGPAEKIYAYLRNNHIGIETNPIGTLISYLKRIEGVKVGKYEGSVKTRELEKLYHLEEIESLLAPLNEMCAGKPVYVLTDELDKGWDGSEDAKCFVAGLFQAATAIRQRTPNIHVLVSLRRELYENIPSLYDDAQKVRDVIETIEWNETALKQLVASRIRHSLPVYDGESDDYLWNRVFSEVLDYRHANSYNYIVDRTLYRPRELIQLCSIIKDVAVEENKIMPLQYDVIRSGEQQYSAERLKDIASEYQAQFPGLGTVLETFRGMSYALSRTALDDHWLKISTKGLRIDEAASTWCTSSGPEQMIQALWQVGFLKAQAVGGLPARRRSGSEYVGSHQVPALNLENIGRFHVHPMFRAALGLKEGKAGKE